ncbi:MAG: phage major capsid protein [Clostridiales bacterium]|nr:phage major capsid protein [Clostridiales bacterium]MBQ1574526.1 phage major capsid protein [Clostridiales bacterium]
MTKEEIMELDSDAIEARCTEIAEAIEAKAEGTDFEALSQELDFISERKAALAEQKKADIEAVMEGEGSPVENIQIKEERHMDLMEIRKSDAYVEAFANYIRTGDDTECRSLLTENASGVVPVPELVEGIVRTAWEKDGIMSRVKKAYIKGNLKVSFEISADGAVVHTEGADAPSAENLVLGILELVPASIKKWIKISDETVDMGGEAFLRYVYDELTYQIAKKASEDLIGKIKTCGTVATNVGTTCVGVPVITTTSITLGLIAQAMSQLSPEATDPVIIMNRKSWGAFKAVEAAGNYGYDPFEGLPVLFSNALTAWSAATTGVPVVIVGDLGRGALANFPNGEEITIKYDDKSLAEADLVKVVAREYVGIGVVGPSCFVKINADKEAE